MTETVKVKGKVYQIGGIYGDKQGRVCILVGYNSDDGFEIGYFYQSITSFTAELHESTHTGGIIDAPLELEGGKAYRFDIEEFTGLGIYSEARKAFFNCGNKVCGEGQAKNIKLMGEIK